MKRIIAAGLFALSLFGVAQGAEVRVSIAPPPPPREIVVVRPGSRYVRVPGYYRWDGRRYFWVAGYWSMPPRGRTVWVPGGWQYRGGMHIWVEGQWR
jgi:hypothetical protein